jgi:hypothetical protein
MHASGDHDQDVPIGEVTGGEHQCRRDIPLPRSEPEHCAALDTLPPIGTSRAAQRHAIRSAMPYASPTDNMLLTENTTTAMFATRARTAVIVRLSSPADAAR